MFGKGALIIVLGAVITFSLYQVRLNRAVLSTTDNFNYHYIKTLIHESSQSAMNYAVNDVWANGTTNSTFNVYTKGCTSVVSVNAAGMDTIKAKVRTWGWAYDEFDTDQRVKVQDSILAYFSYGVPISRYFWFTKEEGMVYWITGDTLWGPLHTNDILRTDGKPVFFGKVTAFKGITPNPGAKNIPHDKKGDYLGGFEIGIEVDMPTDFTPLINAATSGNGGASVNTKCIYDTETTFEFLANGDVIRTVSGSPTDTVKVSDIAPTGVIYSTADVNVKGVLDGQLTIYTTTDIEIVGDMLMADDPQANPSSNDILGLIGKGNVIIADNADNNSDCKIQASLMAVEGSIAAENYASRGVSGKLDIFGSLVQNKRGPVGTFSKSTGTITSGFYKRYRYDERLQTMNPPYYPYVRELRLVSWWE